MASMVLLGFNRFLLRFYWMVMGFTGFSLSGKQRKVTRVSMGLTGFFLGFTGFSMGFHGFD